jgi:hypothetical protein
MGRFRPTVTVYDFFSAWQRATLYPTAGFGQERTKKALRVLQLRVIPPMRALLFGAILLMASPQGGNASPWTSPLLTDRIYAISTMTAEKAKAVGVNYPRPIAVLGEKHTYIIGLGSDEIVKLANMPSSKAVLKDNKTLYLDGGRVFGSIEYEVVGAYSTRFEVTGVAIRPAPLNGVELQGHAKTVNFYNGPAENQPAPLENAGVAVLKAPLMAGAFLMWAVVDLIGVTTGNH